MVFGDKYLRAGPVISYLFFVRLLAWSSPHLIHPQVLLQRCYVATAMYSYFTGEKLLTGEKALFPLYRKENV